MIALSVRQPFAFCLFHGKNIENRTWPLPESVRGLLVAIHASSYPKWGWDELTFAQQGAIGGLLGKGPLVEGAIIGVGRFMGCQPREATGLWKVRGQYGFQWEPDIEFKTPIPCKGLPRFFDIELDLFPSILEAK